ncbi:hypothetical protein ARHIZOSPH14_06680 [Agromyces rhizosphaerae]|uniref:Uncharacterized protein n=1 Tax=Agromyces rhizosphaerae TaxID=88374 RepID=A0A9W6CPI1_9MICO|nr:hypothetical protein ARHIZOSPH14_06680 [Agromyces rhizosphaerae]
MSSTAVEQTTQYSTIPSHDESTLIERRLKQVVERGANTRHAGDSRVGSQPPSSAATDITADTQLAKAYRAVLSESPRGITVRPTEYRVAGLQSWTAIVVDTEDDVVTVELRSDDQDIEPVMADFLQSQIGDEVVPGDVLYVTVRTVGRARGLPSRTSSVRLRRLGRWTEAEVRSQQERADALAASLEGLID